MYLILLLCLLLQLFLFFSERRKKEARREGGNRYACKCRHLSTSDGKVNRQSAIYPPLKIFIWVILWIKQQKITFIISSTSPNSFQIGVLKRSLSFRLLKYLVYLNKTAKIQSFTGNLWMERESESAEISQERTWVLILIQSLTDYEILRKSKPFRASNWSQIWIIILLQHISQLAPWSSGNLTYSKLQKLSNTEYMCTKDADVRAAEEWTIMPGQIGKRWLCEWFGISSGPWRKRKHTILPV